MTTLRFQLRDLASPATTVTRSSQCLAKSKHSIRFTYPFGIPSVLDSGLRMYLGGKISCWRFFFFNLNFGHPAAYM